MLSKSLKDRIHESALLVFNEDRVDTLQYTDLAKAGGKPLSKGDEKAKRVEVFITNKAIPNQLATQAGKFAASYSKYQAAKKEYESLKATQTAAFMSIANSLFDSADKLLTRVIKTVGYSITISKESSREKFDKKAFIELLKKEMPNAVIAIDKLVEQCTTITNIAASIDIEVNESLIIENSITKFLSKILNTLKSNVLNVIKNISNICKSMDKNMSDVEKSITAEDKQLFDSVITDVKDLVLSESIPDSTVIKEDETFRKQQDLIKSINDILNKMNIEELTQVKSMINNKLYIN